MTKDLHPWAAELPDLHAQVWARLTRGVHDRHAATRHPTLATVSTDGYPKARTVVLRAADKKTGNLDMHTDLHSAKVAQIRARPFAALHIWDGPAHLQLRLEGNVQILTGADTAGAWGSIPDMSRQAYGSLPAPGQPIPTALEYRKNPDPAAFAILRLGIMTMDILHLGPQHRRAHFSRADDWAGHWLAP